MSNLGCMFVAFLDPSDINWPPKGGGGSFPGGTNSLIMSKLLASATCLMSYQHAELES